MGELIRDVAVRNATLEITPSGTLRVDSVDDPMDFWQASRRFFNDRRVVKTGARNFAYPETTNADVRQLARIWDGVHKKVWRSDLSNADGYRQRWRFAFKTTIELTDHAVPTATFPRNEEFWLVWTKRQAVYLSAVRSMPTKRDLALEVLDETVHELPGAVVRTAGAVAIGVADAGAKAGQIVAAPVRGLFSGLFGGWGRPLLVGALVAGSVLVVPRLLPRAGARAEASS